MKAQSNKYLTNPSLELSHVLHQATFVSMGESSSVSIIVPIGTRPCITLAPRLLSRLAWCAPRSQLSPNGDSYPDEPHNTCNNTVCNLPLDCVPTKHQAQPTIDNSHSHYQTAPPDVRNGPDGTSVVLLIHIMMDKPSNWLEDESSDNDNANNRVAITGRQLKTR